MALPIPICREVERALALIAYANLAQFPIDPLTLIGTGTDGTGTV
jgi:hypothetical protein